MPFGHGVVQRRAALGVGSVERAPMLEKQQEHGDGADGDGAVDGVLAAAVADACGGLVGVGEEEAGEVKVLLGGDEMEGRLRGGEARGMRVSWE